MQYHKWTLEEEQLLHVASATHGTNWELLHAKYFPYIAIECLKNKYYSSVHNKPSNHLTKFQKVELQHYRN